MSLQFSDPTRARSHRSNSLTLRIQHLSEGSAESFVPDEECSYSVGCNLELLCYSAGGLERLRLFHDALPA